MSNDSTFRARQYLPQVVVATTLVAVLPVVVVWVLLVEGVISSVWVCIGLAIALSLAATMAGTAYWKRRSGHGDVLFSEILLWGWLRRVHNERRLASALASLGLADAEAGSSGAVDGVDRSALALRQMAVALDAQDPYTDGHSRRVALHASMIAQRMGMSREEVARIQTAAAVHDVGKLRVPGDVLNKPTTLTPAEFEIVKRHVDDGAEMVSGLEDPELAAMVRHHHERFDGTGYPAGLVGEASPVGARVIAVADTFDALTSDRPYRAAIPHKQAMEIISAASGTQLDPVAVRAFLQCYSGKRMILFWTLLAVSPQRALATFGGRHAGRSSSGSAATVAIPAALAAIVATAVGSVGTLGRAPDPARYAQRVSPPATAGQTSTRRHTGGARDPSHRRSTSIVAKQAALAAVAASPGSASGLAGRPQGAGAGANSGSHGASGGGKSGRSTGGGSGGGSRSGSRGHSGGGSRPSKGGRPGAHPKGGGSPTSTGTVNHPGGGSTGPGAPPTSSTGSSGGTGQGNGGGNGNPGGPGPPSKQACMNGGWLQFRFSNQGLCIAFVEHNLHLSLHG